MSKEDMAQCIAFEKALQRLLREYDATLNVDCYETLNVCVGSVEHELCNNQGNFAEDLSSDAIVSAGRVLQEVYAERAKQDAKWGEQNHPLGTGEPVSEEFMFADQEAAFQKQEVDRLAKAHQLTFWDILFEEVLEVNAETDPAKVRAELVQVAAVAVAMIERIDRGLAARVKCKGFELGDGNTSGCDPSGGSDCPVCGGSGWSDRGGL